MSHGSEPKTSPSTPWFRGDAIWSKAIIVENSNHTPPKKEKKEN